MTNLKPCAENRKVMLKQGNQPETAILILTRFRVLDNCLEYLTIEINQSVAMFAVVSYLVSLIAILFVATESIVIHLRIRTYHVGFCVIRVATRAVKQIIRNEQKQKVSTQIITTHRNKRYQRFGSLGSRKVIARIARAKSANTNGEIDEQSGTIVGRERRGDRNNKKHESLACRRRRSIDS